jgi:phosphopantetheinyl transferase (holo-ACP synthase)
VKLSKDKRLFHVGNDIVDLTNPRSKNKIDDPRFINRILAVEEREQLMRACNPLEILWSFWAGKETAYKICRKLDLRAAFSPRLYQVNLQDDEKNLTKENNSFSLKELSGTVFTKCGLITIIVMIGREYVHCIGTNEASELGSIRWETGCMEKTALKRDESSFVRQMAIKGLSVHSGHRQEAIEIKRFKGAKGLGPPVVYIDGKPSLIDISLSHDGSFAAYAFCKSVTQ